MEILRIGKYAIKISLSNKEARDYKLIDSEEYEDDEIKEAFSKLLDNAKSYTDFTYTGRKIFTEIYPSKDGGCEVFISTVNIENKQNQAQSKQRGLHTAIYEFKSLRRILKACFRLNEIQFKGKSSVYYDLDTEHYFLILENIFSKELKFAFLLEYATVLKPSSILYVIEHYQCISKANAVKQFANLTN